ncbi:MAG: hypothetical protein LUH51_08650 [Firmicutes bacterium]|nr:hypothetical protein [Bacillota bacterium]
MQAYSIFDDFPASAAATLERAGIAVTVHPRGAARPAGEELKALLDAYDILILGTGQKMPQSSFSTLTDRRIIGTASIGTDHICVPPEKRELVRVVNAPKSNRISVAEHTLMLILALEKNLLDAIGVAERGASKKEMHHNPSDLFGKTIGVVGAGGTARAVLSLAQVMGMRCLCATRSPEKHRDLLGVRFVSLDELLQSAQILSVNLPLVDDTYNLIHSGRIRQMREDAIFISLSRPEITDNASLLARARENPMFRVGLDADADKLAGLWDTSMKNVIVTPHIGGGTVESRIRMFEEVSENIVLAL